MRPIDLALPLLFLMPTACTGWRHDSEPAAAVAAPAAMPVSAVPISQAPSASAAAAVAPQTATVSDAIVAAKDTPSVSTTIAAPAPEIPGARKGPAGIRGPSSPAPSHPLPGVQASGLAAKQAVINPAAQNPPTAAPLDLAALEERLRETHAIGVFTKLSLKNQVDDLLDQFRAHYRASGPPPPSGLRERYDLLMLKVLSLLQDGDPPLAKTIGSSREAIWGILSDPSKLAAI